MKRLLFWLQSLPWRTYFRNAKTTFWGAVAFVSYFAGQQSSILPFLPEKWRDGAKAVFGLSLLLMGYYATDKTSGRKRPDADSLPAGAPPPAADVPSAPNAGE